MLYFSFVQALKRRLLRCFTDLLSHLAGMNTEGQIALSSVAPLLPSVSL